MPACHAGGRGFEPLPHRHCALVAQSVEHVTENHSVGGSIPPQGTSGSSSVGRAPPCQGGGRESEPRLPLHFLRRNSQAVRRRSAKPLFSSSILDCASKCAGFQTPVGKPEVFSGFLFFGLSGFAKMESCKRKRTSCAGCGLPRRSGWGKNVRSRLSEGGSPERRNRRKSGGCMESWTLDAVDAILKGEAHRV